MPVAGLSIVQTKWFSTAILDLMNGKPEGIFQRMW